MVKSARQTDRGSEREREDPLRAACVRPTCHDSQSHVTSSRREQPSRIHTSLGLHASRADRSAHTGTAHEPAPRPMALPLTSGRVSITPELPQARPGSTAAALQPRVGAYARRIGRATYRLSEHPPSRYASPCRPSHRGRSRADGSSRARAPAWRQQHRRLHLRASQTARRR